MEEVNQTKIAVSDLEDKLNQLDQFRAEQNSLILAVEKSVTEKLDEIGGEVRENAGKSRDEIRNISELSLLSLQQNISKSLSGKDMTNDKENLWTLVVEIYSSFSKLSYEPVQYMLTVSPQGAPPWW